MEFELILIMLRMDLELSFGERVTTAKSYSVQCIPFPSLKSSLIFFVFVNISSAMLQFSVFTLHKHFIFHTTVVLRFTSYTFSYPATLRPKITLKANISKISIYE